jgi:hypothetical protein
MRTLVSRIVFHMKRARRASTCSSMSGDIGVDAVDPAEHVREQEFGDPAHPPGRSARGFTSGSRMVTGYSGPGHRKR